MKYEYQNQKIGVQVINVCGEQQGIDVYMNRFGTVSIASKPSTPAQSSSEIRLDSVYLDRLIAALEQIKNEF